MYRVTCGKMGKLGSILFGCLVAAVGSWAHAQEEGEKKDRPRFPEPPARQVVLLPPYWGGATPQSTMIHAEASRLVGMGSFVESASIARRHHAIAAEHEMENAKRWVETYFARRELNRQGRLRENPNHLMREEKHQAAARLKIERMYQETLDGDVTKQINWLLRELASLTLAYQYLPGNQKLADSAIDSKLTPRDAYHIRFTDGGHGGNELIFRADDPKVLETRWPRGLRGEEFTIVCRQFDEARDVALEEIRAKGQLGDETAPRLMLALDELVERLNEVYTQQKRTESTSTFLAYANAKRYVQSLAAGVYRSLETNDHAVFDGSYRFDGDSVVDLIDHMSGTGLEFAKPEPGDEGVYKKLFLGMRSIYLNLASEAAGAANNKNDF